MSVHDGKDPDGYTRNGAPWWYSNRKKDDDARILGPWPAWPLDPS